MSSSVYFLISEEEKAKLQRLFGDPDVLIVMEMTHDLVGASCRMPVFEAAHLSYCRHEEEDGPLVGFNYGSNHEVALHLINWLARKMGRKCWLLDGHEKCWYHTPWWQEDRKGWSDAQIKKSVRCGPVYKALGDLEEVLEERWVE